MKKRQIDIAVINVPVLGEPGDKIQELLTYLGSIAPKTLVISAPTKALGITESEPAPYTRLLEKLRLLAEGGCRVLWLTRENSPTDPGFIEFPEELGLHSKTHHTWFPPAGIQGMKGFIADFYLSTGLLSYELLKMLGGSKRTRTAKRTSSCALCTKKLARIALQRGFTEIILAELEDPLKQVKESKYGKCTVMAPGNWSAHLTSLEFNFNRWKSYSYNRDKLLPFYVDEQLKTMNSAALQQLMNRGEGGNEQLSRPA